MSSRTRALLFLVAAALAAVASAALADGYGRSVAAGYGPLRPVLVATRDLKKGEPIDPTLASHLLDVRKVPMRFAPPDALAGPAEAVGLVPVLAIAAGTYLTAGELRSSEVEAPGPRIGGGRRPVEIAVSGSGALVAFGGQPVGSRVDVAVTTEPSGSGSGRTYIAARAVPLLGLAPASSETGGEATATLGLTRSQALELIEAESFARRVTVIPSG
jgi:pilus assembly protein CpaB